MPKPKTPSGEQDRRVRKTRRQLHEALINLILERGWDEVSVQDVCERADVGRSTFYVHFADKEELLLIGLDDLHQMLAQAGTQEKGRFAFAEGLIEHARDKARLLRAIIGKRGCPNVQRQFREVVMQLVQSELADLEIEEKQRQVIVRFIGGGLAELLTTWIDRPSNVDVTAMASTFRQLTLGALATFAPKKSRSPR